MLDLWKANGSTGGPSFQRGKLRKWRRRRSPPAALFVTPLKSPVLPLRPRQLVLSPLGPCDDEAPRPPRQIRPQGQRQRRLHFILFMHVLCPHATREGARHSSPALQSCVWLPDTSYNGLSFPIADRTRKWDDIRP